MACRHCGCGCQETSAPPAGNAQRRHVLEFLDEDIPILMEILVGSSNRNGMYGSYHLARRHKRYLDQIDRSSMPWIAKMDGEGWSQTLAAHDSGWDIHIVPHPKKERTIAFCGIAPDAEDREKDMILGTRFVPPGGDMDELVVQIADFFARRVPAAG